MNSPTEYAVDSGRIDAAKMAAPISPKREEVGCQPAGQWLEGPRCVRGIVDRDAVLVQGRCTGDDDEEPDDTGEERAEDHVDVFVAQVRDVRCLSAAYDWMKLRPHGASVVPTVAVASRTACLVVGNDGTTLPWIAALQSGWASTPDRM